MRNSIVGIIISVIILFISLIVLPTYFVGVIQWRDDMNTCQTAARNFVDMVIDNGQINERAVTDLNLSLGGCYSTFTYEIYREGMFETFFNPQNDLFIKIETEDEMYYLSGVDDTQTQKIIDELEELK